jgi:hypothetical protein
MSQVYAVLILAVLILIFLFFSSKGYFEKFSTEGPEDIPDSKSYIFLYEGFNQNNLAFKFVPEVNYDLGSTSKRGLENGYIKQIIKINLKSIDINLPKLNNKYDEIRHVEIWAIDDESNISSVESDFYNSYLEPEYAMRANPGRYREVLRILPGTHAKLDIAQPAKKIFLTAIL